ncbi:MAG: branched-chain amino acid ABC transporter permease [Proteobacteria bacterium]|nr:branched-chain amino acid ABC transporter permease [Pseudomonadota bacterium]MBU4288089.1 branched-chain amino acid ABC transporter permease [Pseudomonadota bacterium]MCG2829853.1 branched-chain amino acid ABC transporter permease [Desulfobacteraceae bacterium]
MLIQVLINSISAASVYTLIALGFSLIYSTTRFFHFAHGAVYVSGPYFAYLFHSLLDVSLVFSLPLAVASSSILGIALEVFIYKPLRTKGSTSLILLLASLGIYIMIQNIISMIFGDDTKTLRSGLVREGLEFFGARITIIQLTIIIVCFVLLIACWILMNYTKIGNAMRAVASDPELALISGTDPDRVILFAFAIGSALAGIAAILISFDIDMTPTMGMNALMMGVVAVIIGGVGSIPGIALGALLLGMAQHIGVWKIGSQWQDAIAFVILLIFLLFRPQGFLGKKIKKANI